MTKVETVSDSTGTYLLRLPAGRYLLWIRIDRSPFYWSRGGLLPDERQAEPLDLTRDQVGPNLELGGLTVSIETPAVIEGRELTCRVETGPGPGRQFSTETIATVAGSHARFRFPVLAPGAYAVSLYLQGQTVGQRRSMERGRGTGPLWLPPTYSRHRIAHHRVEPSQEVVLTYSLPPPTRISGRVRGSWTTLVPAARPTIEAHPSDGGGWVPFPTDPEGRFSLEVFAPDTMKLCVNISGIRSWIGGTDMAKATSFAPRPGGEWNGVDFEESGILLRFEGQPDEETKSVTVAIEDRQGQAILDPDTRFYDTRPIPLPNLPPGELFLRVAPLHRKATWPSQWFEGGRRRAEATPIRLPGGGAALPVTMLLASGGAFSGRVLDPTGAPYAGRPVFVSPADSLVVRCPAAYTNDETGEFLTDALWDGTYRLGSGPDQEHITWYPGTELFGSASVVVLVSHQRIGGLEWRVRP